MEGEQRDLLAQFIAISGVDSERAQFYLESSGWSLETALSSFYEADDVDEGIETAQSVPNIPPSVGDAARTDSQPVQKPGRQNLGAIDSGEDSSSEEEEGQAFYTGGSETSGQQVLGPPSRKKKDIVSQLFRAAREQGAEEVEGHGSQETKAVRFGGTGYRLGETQEDTVVIPDASRRESRPREVLLKMWRSGFSIDDGPLRNFEDPANAEFIKSIKRGEIPMELIRDARGGEVYLNMADHRHEEFVQPKTRVPAFTGSGHTLGSFAPSLAGQCHQDVMAGTSSSSDITGSMERAQQDLSLDDSQPTSNVQVRLPDGSRLVIKLNHSSTVEQLRQFIETARPPYGSAAFALMTTFPHAELVNGKATIAEAKLLNAAIVVKPK